MDLSRIFCSFVHWNRLIPHDSTLRPSFEINFDFFFGVCYNKAVCQSRFLRQKKQKAAGVGVPLIPRRINNERAV
jgi:hypothetical protein